MARQREFDPNQVLDRVMKVFWRQGYADTSIEDIVAASGVSRYGLYSVFGDKHDLFVKVMDHYSCTSIDWLLGSMEGPDAGKAAIQRYFHLLIQSLDRQEGRLGCLIGNAAVELLEPDTQVSGRISAHFDRMRAAFLNSLRNAATAGELGGVTGAAPDPAKIEALADYLVGIATGYLVCIRANLPDDRVRRFVDTALDRLWLS